MGDPVGADPKTFSAFNREGYFENTALNGLNEIVIGRLSGSVSKRACRYLRPIVILRTSLTSLIESEIITWRPSKTKLSSVVQHQTVLGALKGVISGTDLELQLFPCRTINRRTVQ